MREAPSVSSKDLLHLVHTRRVVQRGLSIKIFYKGFPGFVKTISSSSKRFFFSKLKKYITSLSQIECDGGVGDFQESSILLLANSVAKAMISNVWLV